MKAVLYDPSKEPPAAPRRRQPIAGRADWSRFRRMMGWTMLVAVLLVAAGLYWLRESIGPLPFHLAIATGLGIGGITLLTGALMGLVFLSSRSGADVRADGSLTEGDQ